MYAPQSGLSDVDKDLFFDQLRAVTARIPRSEFFLSHVAIGMVAYAVLVLNTGKFMVGWLRVGLYQMLRVRGF